MNERTWAVPDLLQLSGGYWSVCTLHAAVKLGIFSHLAGKAASADEMARELGCDERGMGMLLNALTALDLLEHEGIRYSAKSFAARYLDGKSSDYIGHIILHHSNLISGWTRLDQAVKTGAPDRERISRATDDDVRENFEMGMFNLAMQLAPQLVRQIDLAGRRTLLDLGGGPGTYAVHFCLQNPGLRAVVFDLPSTAPFAEKTIARFGLGERVSFSAGDFISGEIPGRYDAAWLSHILHGAGADSSALILKKTVSAMEPGGIVMIQEFILDDSRDSPLYPALFSLNMLLGTPCGQSFSQGELFAMLESAGIGDVLRLNTELPNGAGVIAGRVP